MKEELQKAIFSRYNSHGIKFDTWEELKQKTGLTEIEPLCYYCKKQLQARSPYPYKDTVSLDHKTPKCFGGENTIENTVLCCTECNIIKGTMSSQTYFIFLEVFNKFPNEKKLVFQELFWGRKKNKIERERKEKMLWELV
jgi:5-methylcytosine-specific restriction endonuclease McrA